MATGPTYPSTPRCSVVAVSTANTGRDGTGTIVDILTGASAGTRINEIVLHATDNPADSVVTLFIYNGSAYFIYDEIDLGDPAAGSTTLSAFHYSRTYDNLVLPSNSWKLAAAITVALTGGTMSVWAFGADLT